MICFFGLPLLFGVEGIWLAAVPLAECPLCGRWRA